jgi:hypothetical protein
MLAGVRPSFWSPPERLDAGIRRVPSWGPPTVTAKGPHAASLTALTLVNAGHYSSKTLTCGPPPIS